MTENESVLITLQNAIDCATDDITKEDLEMMVKCLEELEQYRAVGTVEGYELAINESIDKHNLMVVYKDRLKEYETIGTIEEFKALKEKNTPYKPQEYEDRYYACKCDNILLPKWRKYPTELMPKSEGLPHCMACGQKLDWSE